MQRHVAVAHSGTDPPARLGSQTIDHIKTLDVSWSRAHQPSFNAGVYLDTSAESPRLRKLKKNFVPHLFPGVLSWRVQERERAQCLHVLRGIPFPLGGRYEANWKREFELPWRKAGLLKLSR